MVLTYRIFIKKRMIQNSSNRSELTLIYVGLRAHDAKPTYLN